MHMPKGSSKSRFDNIAKEGAKVTIEEVNYDDCVRMAAAEAAQTEHEMCIRDRFPAHTLPFRRGEITSLSVKPDRLQTEVCSRSVLIISVADGLFCREIDGLFLSLIHI